jgi:hypothetical protein
MEKKLLREGTVIGDGKIFYGGFPKTLKENNGVVNQFQDDSTQKETNVATQTNEQEPDFGELAKLVSQTGTVAGQMFSGESAAHFAKKKEMGLGLLDTSLPFVKSEALQKAEKTAAEALAKYQGHSKYKQIQANVDSDSIMGRVKGRAPGDWTGD